MIPEGHDHVRTCAVQELRPAEVRCGSKAVLVSCRLQCPVCTKADIVDCTKGAILVMAAVRLTGFMECRIGTAASFRLDVGRPDHLCPFFGLVGDELAKIGGRARKHRSATFSETPP